MAAESSPRIAVVDANPIRGAILEEGLREAGYTLVAHIGEMNNLLARVYRIDPDVVLIDVENPGRDVLEQMFQVSRAVRRPIAMFVDQSDAASIQASVDAGVSAYIVDGFRKERIKSIIDLCISRFNVSAKLQDELERTRSALGERKVIDRAKVIRSAAMRERRKSSRSRSRSSPRRSCSDDGHRKPGSLMPLRIGFIPLVDPPGACCRRQGVRSRGGTRAELREQRTPAEGRRTTHAVSRSKQTKLSWTNGQGVFSSLATSSLGITSPFSAGYCFLADETFYLDMFTCPEHPAMRALSLCRSRLEALQRRTDRWLAITFYGAISFMTLIVVVTLPYRPF